MIINEILHWYAIGFTVLSYLLLAGSVCKVVCEDIKNKNYWVSVGVAIVMLVLPLAIGVFYDLIVEGVRYFLN